MTDEGREKTMTDEGKEWSVVFRVTHSDHTWSDTDPYRVTEAELFGPGNEDWDEADLKAALSSWGNENIIIPFGTCGSYVSYLSRYNEVEPQKRQCPCGKVASNEVVDFNVGEGTDYAHLCYQCKRELDDAWETINKVRLRWGMRQTG